MPCWYTYTSLPCLSSIKYTLGLNARADIEFPVRPPLSLLVKNTDKDMKKGV